jgi:hypothetical protein
MISLPSNRWMQFALLLVLTFSSLFANAQNFKLLSKTRIGTNIYDFDYQLTTGPGKYDHIVVHRVVQLQNGKPIVSNNAVLLTHGDTWNFQQAFLAGNSKQSIAYYLANESVDVWGIDLAWTLVPSTETDFTFMKTWGMGHDITDMETALTFARKIRNETGSGNGRLNLLAWSRGGWLGYGLLNQESQEQCAQRQVKGYISVDNFFKTDSKTSQNVECSYEASENGQIQKGVYEENTGPTQLFGEYAVHDPNGPSVLLGSKYTNLQASLVLGAAVYQFGPNSTPYFHFVGGYFPHGINDTPNGLAYSNIGQWNGFVIGSSYYEPYRLLAETDGITCGDANLPFDKHLKDIAVPIHYVGAGGGFGSYGLYTLSLLGSTDVSNHIVSLFPPEKAALDFGHVDLFYADNAPKLAWNDILAWLKGHEGDDSCSAR